MTYTLKVAREQVASEKKKNGVDFLRPEILLMSDFHGEEFF